MNDKFKKENQTRKSFSYYKLSLPENNDLHKLIEEKKMKVEFENNKLQAFSYDTELQLFLKFKNDKNRKKQVIVNNKKSTPSNSKIKLLENAFNFNSSVISKLIKENGNENAKRNLIKNLTSKNTLIIPGISREVSPIRMKKNEINDSKPEMKHLGPSIFFTGVNVISPNWSNSNSVSVIPNSHFIASQENTKNSTMIQEDNNKKINNLKLHFENNTKMNMNNQHSNLASFSSKRVINSPDIISSYSYYNTDHDQSMNHKPINNVYDKIVQDRFQNNNEYTRFGNNSKKIKQKIFKNCFEVENISKNLSIAFQKDVCNPISSVISNKKNKDNKQKILSTILFNSNFKDQLGSSDQVLSEHAKLFHNTIIEGNYIKNIDESLAYSAMKVLEKRLLRNPSFEKKIEEQKKFNNLKFNREKVMKIIDTSEKRKSKIIANLRNKDGEFSENE